MIGKEKNRNGFLWGFFLGIIGLIVLAILPPLEENGKKHRSRVYTIKASERKIAQTDVKCPSCSSIIDAAYNICPYCGENLKSYRSRKIQKIFSSNNRNEHTKIQCPYCNKQFNIDDDYEHITTFRCIYCNKKITKKNVIIM